MNKFNREQILLDIQDCDCGCCEDARERVRCNHGKVEYACWCHLYEEEERCWCSFCRYILSQRSVDELYKCRTVEKESL